MASQVETKRIPFSTISQTLEQGIDGADPARADGLQRMHQLRAVKATSLEREKVRLSKKLGAQHSRVLALNERIEFNRSLVRDLAVEVEHARTQIPTVDKDGWVLHGFVRDKDFQGVPNLTVAIYLAGGTWVQQVGNACTDDKGYFKLSYSRSRPDKTEDSEKRTVFVAAAAGAETRGPEVFIHVLDKSGAHIYIDRQPLTPQLGNVDYREIILGDVTSSCWPPDHDKDLRPDSNIPMEL
jgi:hypothetical protein